MCCKIIFEFEKKKKSPTAAHMGTNRTWVRARNNFWWEDMKQDIDNFVRDCKLCSKNKHVNKPNEAPQSIFITILPYYWHPYTWT